MIISCCCCHLVQEMLDESDQSVPVLESCDPARQQSLAAEAEVDAMDAEQTFPTEQELVVAEEERGLSAPVIVISVA